MTWSFTAWVFHGSEAAQRAEAALAAVSVISTSTVADGIQVSWSKGRPRPRTRQLQNTALMDPLGDGFWGLLVSTLFFLPVLPSPKGSGQDQVVPSLAGIGLSDVFLEQVRSAVVPDASALMVLSSVEGTQEQASVLSPRGSWPITTVITDAHRAVLRGVFGG